MKKRFLAVLATGLFFLCITGLANAALTTIGTATYSGSDYNLIWDNNNNGNSVIWLDYFNSPANWATQNAWAAGLDSSLTYNIDSSAYTVTWDDTAWRLPSAGANPQEGYNQTSSEMGDLFYNDLGLSASPPTTTDAQLNATNFDNLIAKWYWSGTGCAEPPDRAWLFRMDTGNHVHRYRDITEYGLAVRSGDVSPVPLPGGIYLLGSGLIGLVSLRRRKQGNTC